MDDERAALASKTAAILSELLNFDGQIAELCTISEMEGQFGMPCEEMLNTIMLFVGTFAENDGN